MRGCEGCGAEVALFAGSSAGGPPIVRCARCMEALRPLLRRVWLVQGGVSVAAVPLFERLVRELLTKGVVTVTYARPAAAPMRIVGVEDGVTCVAAVDDHDRVRCGVGLVFGTGEVEVPRG